MKRRLTSWFNPRGFLLVEATLTAVVIAVGLVAVTRGISSSLATLSRLQQHDRLLRLAESQLQELEALAHQGQPLQVKEQLFDAPDEAYRWIVTSRPISLSSAGIPDETLRAVNLTVRPAARVTPLVSLHVVWPKEWIQE